MSQFFKAAHKSDVDPGMGVVSEIEGKSVAIFNVDGSFYAINNICPHKGGPLGEGELEGCVVTCPWHAWQFDVTTGKNTENENLQCASYPVKVEGDIVYVEL